MGNTVNNVVKKYNGDATRLMDILIDIQSELGHLSEWTIEQISKTLDMPRVSIEQTVSFYHFFTQEPRGKYTVYLNNSAVAGFFGRGEVAKAFEEAAACCFGHVTSDGLIGLFDTACIGMSDQEPAAIINDQIFTNLTPGRAKKIIAEMKSGKTVEELKGGKYGDGKNSNPLIRSMVNSNIMGGLPSLRNWIPLKECLEEAYLNGPTVVDCNEKKIIPDDPDIPKILDRVYPCHEVVKIDYFLPGCPPCADLIWHALYALVTGKPLDMPYEVFKYD